MRPQPPAELLEPLSAPRFIPAPDIIEWARATFIAPDAELVNEDHAHLNHATLGALWTNVPNGRNGRRIVGQCERGLPQGAMGRWAKARAEQQVIGWFGQVPDFILTFDACYWAECSDAEAMALVEHEIYHAGQEIDEFGAPKFKKTGEPAFGIRGHDIEEFVGVVRRYGAGAAHVEAMVAAAKAGPEISAARIARACGTCALRAA
jgi:hypothetical protein